MEDVEEESEDAGQALAKWLKLSMERRYFPEVVKLLAIYDFRILKNSKDCNSSFSQRNL